MRRERKECLADDCSNKATGRDGYCTVCCTEFAGPPDDPIFNFPEFDFRPWMREANCGKTDALQEFLDAHHVPLEHPEDVFFPEKGQGNYGRLARQVCASCPVKQECLEYAIESGEQYGIWGGMNAKERYKERRKMEKRRAS